MTEPRPLNNFGPEDRVQLGSDLDRLTDRYVREGFDAQGIHFELTILTIGWLLYNGVPANIVLEGVEIFVARLEEQRRAEAEQAPLQ